MVDSILIPKTTRLPVAFIGRGLIHSESGIRYVWIIQQTTTAMKKSSSDDDEEEEEEEEEEEDEEIKSDVIVAWHRDGQITLTTHTGTTTKEELSQKQLFAAIDQVLFCDFGDRGHIRTTTTVFSSFFLFIKNTTITVRNSIYLACSDR